MCGVIGLILERDRADMGELAAELLRALEYRGYDSTGAAVQADGGDVELRKGVGAPSKVCEPLGITRLEGRVFCGQVRWATFGAVDEVNAQPHVVGCHVALFGAHNGNVTNCDDLQGWLRERGHTVRSDNDGEMVVHMIEHHFAAELEALAPAERGDEAQRRTAMRRAIVAAHAALEGSFAAVVVDRRTRVVWAIKAGSSLYAGLGEDPEHGAFAIASSDLSCVLRMTRRLVPMQRGEFVEMTHDAITVYSLSDGERRERSETRSRLLARDIELQPEYATYMEQEIAAQAETVRDVVRAFGGGSERLTAVRSAVEQLSAGAVHQLDADVGALRAEPDLRAAIERLEASVHSSGFKALSSAVAAVDTGDLHSSERALLSEMAAHVSPHEVAVLDAWIEYTETATFETAVDQFVEICAEADRRGGRLWAVCCGSSYHAARAGAQFFHEAAGVPLFPCVPGEFRGQYQGALRDGDVLIVVTQSGETKDVVDVLTDVIASGRDVRRLALVNNVNSTIAQELAEVVVPLRCGPEIAVAATKSFVNQLAVFHGLALALGRRRLLEDGGSDDLAGSVEARQQLFEMLPGLITRTLSSTLDDVEAAAEMLYLVPSMHILATRLSAVALEGALKVREVVLNHTQGYEAAEFKHGPNTILGRNTLYGPLEVRRMLSSLGGIEPSRVFAEPTGDLVDTLTSDYPLLYVTGPGGRDVAITVSQVNTHKIRGSVSIAVAEDDPSLRQAIEKAPAGRSEYRSLFIALPPTGDPIGTTYTATVVLQRLALRMSEKKAAMLDRLGVIDHGVHPDVPKNVSKSITVD